jgi:hypothetical protein
MSPQGTDPLERSATRIADGLAVDWSHDDGLAPAARRSLERLERIASAWRALGAVPPAEDPGAGGEAPLFLWGDLEVRERLGEGSFGEVYRAFEPTLEREVALKLRPDDGDEIGARRALDEARRLARVRHRHVLAVHGADVHDGRAGFWTELVRGRTLEDLLAERGPWSGEEAALVGLDLCRALAAVHAEGLVHGDLKAANVMREDGGRTVLMDFGSAARAGQSPARLTGSPLSLAPEVLEGGAPTAAADLYALGALLHRLVTARHPYEAPDLATLRERQRRGERPSLRALRPDLAPHVVAAIERALERDSEARFTDAGAFESALLAPSLARGQAALAEAPAPPRPARPPRWLWAAAAVVLAVLALQRFPASPPEPRPDAEPQSPAAGAEPAPAAPTAIAPARPAPAPVARLAAQAVLWRTREGERVPLADGGAVQPGDHLHLEFASAEPVHVYVLNEDAAGEAYTLFPVSGADRANPVPAGEHRLPGALAGRDFDWVVTCAGGREEVLVVASRRPVAALERQVAAMPAAEPGRTVAYAPVGEEQIAALRGIGGMAAAPPGTREGRLARLARDLAAGAEPGLWVRRLTLEGR